MNLYAVPKIVNQLYQYINPFGGKHEKVEKAELGYIGIHADTKTNKSQSVSISNDTHIYLKGYGYTKLKHCYETKFFGE